MREWNSLLSVLVTVPDILTNTDNSYVSALCLLLQLPKVTEKYEGRIHCFIHESPHNLDSQKVKETTQISTYRGFDVPRKAKWGDAHMLHSSGETHPSGG